MSNLLIFLFSLIPSLSVAGSIYFPLIQDQAQNVEWICKCPNEERCVIENFQGKSVLTVPSHCSIETPYSYSNNQEVKAIRFEVKTIEKLESLFSVQISQNEKTTGIRHLKMGINTVEENWYFDTITGYSNKKQMNKPRLAILNILSKPLHLIEAKVHQSTKERIGAILTAQGGGLQGEYVYDENFPDYAWVPLPLDYKSQVPLYVNLEIQPESLIKSIQYQADELGNWGASVYFVPNISNGTKINFTWDVAVLTNDVLNTTDNDQLIKNPAEWLETTDMVQASNEKIETTAYTILANNSKTETVHNIVSWLTTQITAKWDGKSLDALHVYETKGSTCTGYANLAAALGRTLKIPTLTLAGYQVGLKQETHWINEFYLGDQGWLRVEPQGLIGIDSEYFIPVRIDRIKDEIYSGKMLFGIPSNAYPIIPVNFKRPDNNYYLVEAFNYNEFTAPPNQMNEVFDKAKHAWRKDFESLITFGNISIKRQSIRREISKAKSLKKVNELLNLLVTSQ